MSQDTTEKSSTSWYRLPRGHMDMLGICDADGVFIAHIAEHSEEFSHARLIVVAPELLAELKRYHKAAEGAWNELVAQGGNEELVQSGRESLDATAALISKAEGRE